MAKLSIAIHKLTSCSGCQLAFLNQGETLLTLLDFIEILHFVEAGIYHPDCKSDIAFIEGSISTQEDVERAISVRSNSKLVVSMGACATSGGLQALRNFSEITGGSEYMKAHLYTSPEFVKTLDRSEPVAQVIDVDYELWGCPVSTEQLEQFISQIIVGSEPKKEVEKLCMACKRQQTICVLVTKQSPCLGPITRTGCGALCPSYGKACYGCYGPSEQSNCRSLSNRLRGLGLVDKAIVNRFTQLHSNTVEYQDEIVFWSSQCEKDK